MKILLLIGDITLGGGAERVVCNLANGFNALGHDVEILSFYKDGEKSLYEIHKNIKISFFYKTPRKQVFKKPFHRLYYKPFSYTSLTLPLIFILYCSVTCFTFKQRNNNHF
ncbi:glycosyltransferase family protein [Campylobacter coli]|uniref:hypothetical protein n=1 Tax=Campylobacter coli TaxID=195 RepID=UPI00381C8328